VEPLVLVNLGVVKFDDDLYSVGNIDYNTLSDFLLMELVRMPMWITLYWTKEVNAKRIDGIRFFQG
jgi:hypothetical protein